VALARWRALLHDSLDLPAIARYVVGPTAWQRTNEEQRAELTTLIEARLAEFYASRVKENAGASLSVSGAEALGEDGWLVSSIVTRADGTSETIEWRVERADGMLRIRDIIAGGNSLAAARRTEYGQILQRNGGDPAALIETLRARALHPDG
jgi:ABC-type transporter MlaC component